MFRNIAALIFLLILGACQNQQEGEKATRVESNPKVTPAMEEEEPAIQRIVAFKFKEGATKEAINQHMRYFEALSDSIPQILSYRAGSTFPVDYESTADFDVLHYSTFSSEEDIKIYFEHPAHQRFIKANQAIWDNVTVINARLD
ncbi:Dabb family protein [Porifericola rhodea]|uniref:Dabb family protein n=1 Tax=Porifericola rhodea TaxID=930972 RepID=UPI0026671321|nr:Dabb family protein [Porifericola rhodea]WKN32401.1 Dabb family protein [Porifericola rhodea]